MTDTRRPIDTRAASLMVLLCFLWALQQVMLKAAAVDVPPLFQLALRSGIAVVLVWFAMRWQGIRLPLNDTSWRPGMLVGFLFALEFLFIGEGLRYTSASRMVVFLYTAPIFVALALHWRLPSERLSALQWTGVALAFAGLVIAFAERGDGAQALPRQWLGDVMAILGALAWAATTVAVRLSSLAREPASKTLFHQLLGGFVLLLLASVVLDQIRFNPTPLALGALAFQALIVSFASYLAWFWLLRRYLASQIGVLSFLTPLFGVGLGVWLLNEPLEPAFLLGAVLVCAGIGLVSGHAWIRSVILRR